jgi:cell division ATPase FtsA
MRIVNKTYASMDIGSESIRLLIARYTEQGLKIEHYSHTKSAGIARGEIIDTNKCQKIISDFVNPHRNKINSIVVNISSPLIDSFRGEGTTTIGGRVNKDDIDSAIFSNLIMGFY